jgi:xanthine/CO dehydrogenase XdhC/CoxF family maturation factor
VQLGCNGIVHILFEPIDHTQPGNPIALLEKFYRGRKNAVLATIYSVTNKARLQPGTCFFLNEDFLENKIEGSTLAAAIPKDAAEALMNGLSFVKEYPEYELSGFYELLQPPVSLVIFGAGNDVLPLVDMAKIVGWTITIIDGRASHANKQRFPKADIIIVARPEEALDRVVVDERTVFVLMTHNYNYDRAMMKLLLETQVKYIGALGPRTRLERLLSELQEQGTFTTEKQTKKIYGPTGLDIGAETPEEIALSILAEIKAVLAGHPGTFLRMRSASIHPRPFQNLFPNSS